MRPCERLELARASYVRAINLVRGASTPASWRRALAAARNLARAKRDEARSRGSSPLGSRREVESGPAAGSTRCRIFTLSREPGEAGIRAVCAWPVLSDTLAELDAHCKRAEVLMHESARLVGETRALLTTLIEERRLRLLSAAGGLRDVLT